VFEVVEPGRVVDVGCGTGSWLAVARELGCEDVLGIDGDYVDRAQLEIPEEQFLALDLTRALPPPSSFDLAISLEVGEHLPPSRADAFVESLTSLAPVVLFSSAVPNQGGTGHVNEQWQDWWAGLFARHGCVPVDCLRHRIWNDQRVRYFYAQNMLLYVHSADIERLPRLPKPDGDRVMPLNVVHPRLFTNALARFPRPEAVSPMALLRFGVRLTQFVLRRMSRKWRGRGSAAPE
jgi:SAM-dependent methyltransferase